MKRQLCLSLALLLLLSACGGAAPTAAPVPTMTIPPEAPSTSVSPTTLPPTESSTAAPAMTSAPAPAVPVPTDTAPVPAATDTLQPTDTPTAIPATPRPRPTATSSGPLSANIYVANCRSAPTADKPGRVLVQISVEANGGNGRYRYFYQDQEFPTKFIELPGEKGTRLIGEVRVTSSDGQDLTKEFDISISQLNCP